MSAPLATWWLWEPPATPLDSAYWRAELPARHVPGAVRALTDRDAPQSGSTAIFVVPHRTQELYLLGLARQQGLRVVVESDDAWLDLDPRALAMLDVPVDADPRELAAATRLQQVAQLTHATCARRADAVVVSTQELARSYGHLNANVHVARNAIDESDWPPPEKPDDGVFRAGFAGSTSHSDDVHLIRDALAWATAQPGVAAAFVGWDPAAVSPTSETRAAFDVSAEAHALMAAGRSAEVGPLVEAAVARNDERRAAWRFPLELIPWTNERDAYARNLARLDVGLAPLDPSAGFTRGRSDVKVLEYAMCGVLPIVSRSEAYSEWLDLVPSARNAAQFLEHVRWAAEHRDEARALAARVRERVLATRTIDREVDAWRKVLRP